jgi:hypothetical protein
MQYVLLKLFLAGLLIALFSSIRDNSKLCQFASVNPNSRTSPRGFALQRSFHLPHPRCCLVYLMYGSLYHLFALRAHHVSITFFIILSLRSMHSTGQDSVIYPVPKTIEHIMPYLSDGFAREELEILVRALPGIELLPAITINIKSCKASRMNTHLWTNDLGRGSIHSSCIMMWRIVDFVPHVGVGVKDLAKLLSPSAAHASIAEVLRHQPPLLHVLKDMYSLVTK